MNKLLYETCNDCGRTFTDDLFCMSDSNGTSGFCYECVENRNKIIRAENQNKKLPKLKNLQYRCVVCNKQYIPNRRKQKYCSKSCYKAYIRKAYRNKITTYSRNKFMIFERDHFRCIYCGKSSIEEEIELHVDHVIPRNLGGKSIASNLITACMECNISKSNIELDQEIIDRIYIKIKQRNKQAGISNDRKIKLGYKEDK